MNIDIIIYILLFATALRYPALVIMYAVLILINTLTSTYLQNLELVNINSTGSLFINLLVIYKLYKYCLSKVVTTNKKIEKSEGVMSIFNIFKERTCEDGILCSFIVKKCNRLPVPVGPRGKSMMVFKLGLVLGRDLSRFGAEYDGFLQNGPVY